MKLAYLKIFVAALAFALFILLTPTKVVNISQTNYSSSIVSYISSAFAATFDDSLVPNADNTFDIGQIAPNLRWRNANFAGTVTLGTGLSGGSLGIGTETPSGYFDIASSTATVFIVSSNGNVGINNASPSATLDVNEGSGNNLGLALRSNGAGWGSGLQLINTSTTGRSYGIYAGADGNLHFADVASSSDRMIISSAGNVGIGTVPTASLDVVNSTAADQTPIVIFGDGSNSNRYQFLADRGGGAVFQFTSSGIDSIRSAGDLRFEVNGSTSPTLYISSSGYVGIGTTTPDQILTVAGTLHVTSGGIEFPDGTVQTTTCTNVVPTNGSSTWATAGTYTWTVPSGVTRVIARIWGAGGGGGGSGWESSSDGYGGGGGGGGAYAMAFINVTPGQQLQIIVGAGGSGGSGGGGGTTSGGNGDNGGSSSIGSITIPGGVGGTGGVGVSSFGVGGSGGSIVSGSNIMDSWSGGTGGTPSTNTDGGGGGGGAGTDGSGGSVPTGNTSYIGGSGGTGGNGVGAIAGGTGGESTQNPGGYAGSTPGGGGGSSYSNWGTTYIYGGGAGGSGEVILFW